MRQFNCHTSPRRLVALLCTTALLFPTGVPAIAPIIPAVLSGLARFGPRIGQTIGRAVGRGAAREARDQGLDAISDAINGNNDNFDGEGAQPGIISGDGRIFRPDAPFGCVGGVRPADECEEFRVDAKRDLLGEKRNVGEGMHLEIVDASEENFWNSCVGQTERSGRPQLEWQEDDSLMLTGLQPACMVEIQWWNSLPEIGELEGAYGRMVEIEEGKVHWIGLPAEEKAMLKGLTNLWGYKEREQEKAPKDEPWEHRNENSGQKKKSSDSRTGQENSNQGDDNSLLGGYHRSWRS